jgi:hypothetical protein
VIVVLLIATVMAMASGQLEVADSEHLRWGTGSFTIASLTAMVSDSDSLPEVPWRSQGQWK